MSYCKTSSVINSRRFAARVLRAKARFIDAQNGAELLVDEDLRHAAHELLGLETATWDDVDHHLLYVSGGRILHVAYVEAHDRVFGPPADCDDNAYTTWWRRHHAWRRGIVSAAAYSKNAEDTMAFFAIGKDADNPYPKVTMPATSSNESAGCNVPDAEEDGDRPPGRLRLLCPSCKSADVLRDAYAKWSVEDQAWVLADVFDFMVCQSCETEARDVLEVKADA